MVHYRPTARERRLPLHAHMAVVKPRRPGGVVETIWRPDIDALPWTRR